ncbi:MAG TPA: GGDEF domain-containing phosphodiesterase [Candidatus Binatia bacterium]|nr:GGDEF domain-containing phosphodiesterase [Candidatus Binatia bacterium]
MQGTRMTWKAPSRGSGTGLIGKLAQANIDEVAPVDDEVVVVRDDDPGSAPLRQRLAASTLLRVREVTAIDDLAELTATGRSRAVVLCRRGLSLVQLHEAVAATRERCPDVALVVLDDQGGEGREAVASHAGADGLTSLTADWSAVGGTVLGAAERRARARAIGDVLAGQPDSAVLEPLQETWPLALLLFRAENLLTAANRYARGDLDTLLLALGVLIRPVLRPSDLLARLPDNSLLIARRDSDELAIAALADRVLRACRQPLSIGEESVPITAGIGIAVRRRRDADRQTTAAELLAQARTALGRTQGRGRASYELADSTLQARVTAQRQTEIALRHALDNHEFRVFYQPVVELASGALLSFEALMRWQRPQVGLFDAGSFVGAAQRSGLMTRIGQTILHEAAGEAAGWATGEAAPPALSVNLSPQEYFMPTLVPSLGRILTEVGLPVNRLLLELPCKLLARDPVSARSILRDLASLGVTLGVDDYEGELNDDLRRLPIRLVKLRMGLLDQIETDVERRASVAEMVSQVLSAGWLCVGKGVETAAQAAVIRDLGCQGGQGFLFSGARPAEELGLFRGPGGVWSWTPRARSLPAG